MSTGQVENSAGNKKVVLVTGASRGIGRAVSLAFAQDGHTVVVNYRSEREKAEALAEEIRGMGAEALVLRADVSRAAEVRSMADEAAARFGRIDVLVNNAGASKGGFLMLIGEDAWDDVIDTNLKGVFNSCKSVLPHMIDRKEGAIVNVASLSGITGLAGETPYSAAKGGVIAFTKALAKEVAPFGIRVNSVAPGMIETDMTGRLPAADRKRFESMIPLRRFGRTDEVAGVVRFLASAEAGYVTGETIIVSGGMP